MPQHTTNTCMLDITAKTNQPV